MFYLKKINLQIPMRIIPNRFDVMNKTKLNYTHPVFAKFVQYTIIDSDSKRSSGLYLDANGVVAANGAPKTYGKSSPTMLWGN